jgi:hypothetical protein
MALSPKAASHTVHVASRVAGIRANTPAGGGGRRERKRGHGPVPPVTHSVETHPRDPLP